MNAYWLGKKRNKSTREKISKSLSGRIYANRKYKVKKCEICSSEIDYKRSYANPKYCSRKCCGIGKIGRFREEKSPHWKGDNSGKINIHLWVVKWKGKPKKCEVCGTEKDRVYDWANVDHSYKRILDDYIRMCRPCHRAYDVKNNNYPSKWCKGYPLIKKVIKINKVK